MTQSRPLQVLLLVCALVPRAQAQVDCNGNGVPDATDITNGTAQDCSHNGIPDSCDLAPSTGLTADNHIAVAAGPFSLIAADMNGDTRPDLVLVSRSTNQAIVLLGDGAGGFTSSSFPVGTQPESVVAADFNKDQLMDLATANFGGNTVSILRNATSGGALSFLPKVDVPVGPNPSFIVALDVDGNGVVDLAVANTGDNTISKLINDGNGAFTASPPQPVCPEGVQCVQPAALATADFDGDGRGDLAVANFGSDNISVLLSSGVKPPPTPATFSGPFWLTAGEFDGDGKPDLAVANADTSTVITLRNNGDGSFTAGETLTAVSTPVFVGTADYNGDGKQDLLVADAQHVLVFAGDGKGGFLLTRQGAIGDVNSMVAGVFRTGGGLQLAVLDGAAGQVSVLKEVVTPPVSKDCNSNAIPDECEVDSNGNGIIDACEPPPPPPSTPPPTEGPPPTVVNPPPAAETPTAPPGCGAGGCGAGTAGLMPLGLISLGGLRRRHQGRGCRRHRAR